MYTTPPDFIPAPYRHGRRRRQEVSSPPTPAAPVLVAAAFDVGTMLVSLTFDRAIDVTGLVMNEVVVFDGNLGIEWGGTAEFSQPTPQSLEMTMIEQGEYTGEGYKLSAIDGAGIKSSEGGVSWAGVSDVVLPLP
jgi:hypothetical protein